MLGEVTGAHGIRGQVRVRAYNPETKQLAADREVVLEHEGTAERRRIERASRHGRGMLLALEGVTSRTDAERLKGARLSVDAADLPALASDEYYDHEILGCEVLVEGGRPIGRIARTMSTGLNEVWIVRAGEREHLIPVIEDVVIAIERDARRVVIRALPGLLD